MTATGADASQEVVQIIPMTSTEMRALSEIERYWIKHGKWPKVIQTEGFDLTQSLTKESFIRGLFNRGITPPANVNGDLDQAQLAAILIVADYNDRRSLTAKLKSIGVTTQTWQGWMKDRNFKDFLHSLSTQNFEDALHVAQQGLLASVDKGDVNAIKYWHELTGRAVSPEVQNVRVLISQLVQILQTHIKDEAVLVAIGKDIDRVMRGERPSSVVMIERTV